MAQVKKALQSGLRGVPGLAHSVGAVEPIQLLSLAALPVGGVGVLAVPGGIVVDQVVLAGDEPLHPAGAVDVLVAGVLHGPLPVLPGTVPNWLGFLHQKTVGLLASDFEGQSTLLADGVKHQAVLAQELSSQLARLIAHVEPVALLLVGHEVSVPVVWLSAGGRWLSSGHADHYRQ